jgi:hypothetical protein
MAVLVSKGMKIENMVLNAGVLKYPNVGDTFPADRAMLTPLVESYGNVRAAGLSIRGALPRWPLILWLFQQIIQRLCTASTYKRNRAHYRCTKTSEHQQ